MRERSGQGSRPIGLLRGERLELQAAPNDYRPLSRSVSRATERPVSPDDGGAALALLPSFAVEVAGAGASSRWRILPVMRSITFLLSSGSSPSSDVTASTMALTP